MQTINLTNPGQTPVDGDLINITYSNGASEQKQYWAPVAPPVPTRKDVINARLARIDVLTDKPRTRREMLLGNAATIAYAQTLDNEAVALRTELAGLP